MAKSESTETEVEAKPEAEPQERPYYRVHEDDDGDLVANVYLRKTYRTVTASGNVGKLRELTLREPRFGVISGLLDKFADRKGELSARMLAELAGQPVATIRQLLARDSSACLEAMSQLGFDLKDLDVDGRAETQRPGA